LSIRRADSLDEKIKKAKQVASKLLGDKSKGIEPQNISQVTKSMGFKSTKSTYFYRDLAVENGFLQLDKDGKPVIGIKSQLGAFKEFSKNHILLEDELVSYWYKKQLNKKGGKGITISKDMLSMLERFFNTLRITPEMLIIEKSNRVVEDYRDEFLQHYRDGTDKRKDIGMKRGNIATLNLRINYTLASFCAVNGISWARGDPAMSRKIVGHGQYAKERLSDEEFVKSEEFLLEKFGLDSDEYRWFWVGIETCSRFGALESMKLQFDSLIGKNGRETLIMQAYESKTKEKNGGMWEKYIKRSQTIESLKLLKARGGTRIFENVEKLSKIKFKHKMQDGMKAIFSHIGKDPDSYYFKKPTHILRHLGAQRLLAKGNFTNHVLVAKVGGWHTVDELINSYGDMPPDIVNQELDKYDY